MNMATYRLQDLFRSFPKLNKKPLPFTVTSPPAPYNCIAWAVGDSYRLWWPIKGGYWPKGCSQELTIPAFVEAFATLGYKPCQNGRFENDYEKMVLYAKNNEPTHAARQLKKARWTSKLGLAIDIMHRARDLEGPLYGKVVQYFHRPRQK